MRLKIFSCHHQVPEFPISTEIFQTLVSGIPSGDASTFWSDLDGRNIASRQKFCEMRHQYYVWQNLLADYDHVGFEHYRRPFFLDPLPFEVLQERHPTVAGMRLSLASDLGRHELKINRAELTDYNAMRNDLDAEQNQALRDYVGAYDVLFTFPMMVDVNHSFMTNHANAEQHWLSFAQTTSGRFLPRLPAEPAGFAAGWSGYLNMYVMTTELFAEYMEFVFPALLDIDDDNPDAPARIWGHVTERTLGPFLRNKLLEKPMLRIGSIPYLFQDRVE